MINIEQQIKSQKGFIENKWRILTIGEFCPFYYGKALTQPERKKGNIPVVSSAGITGCHNKALVDSSGIIIGRKGTVGNITLCDEPFWAIDTAFYILDDPQKRDLYFTYYLLKNLDFSAMNSDSAVPGLNRDHAHAMLVKVPSIKEQKKISNILRIVDLRIELIQQTNITLESIAQALFKSWFIDFDPVHAKAEGREPEGMDAETAALFPDSFEESELGLVPKGWKIQQIGDVVQLLGGGTPSTKVTEFWQPEVHHWLTPKDLSGISSPVILDTQRKISPQGLSKVSSGLLPINTLLMSSRAPIGYLAIAKIPTAINQGFIAIPPHTELSPAFLLLWCQQNMELIKQKANGSTFMEISKKAFRSIRMVYPSSEVLRAFADVVTSLYENIANNEHKIKTLNELRDTLLPRLISGQLILKKSEKRCEK